MPSPSTVVTFTDAAGDEFPFRVFCAPGAHRKDVIATARDMAREEIEAGDIAPEVPLRLTSMSGVWDGITQEFVAV